MKRLLILLFIATGLFAQSESGGYYIPSKWKLSGSTISPSLSTWSVGLPVTTATSLALGGATIGTNALAVTGTSLFGGNIYLPGGTVALPSLSFSGDTNTGLYSYGADAIGFALGGVFKGGFVANEFYLGISLNFNDQVRLRSDAAGIFTQRNGIENQLYRIYDEDNTGSNDRYLELGWLTDSSAVFRQAISGTKTSRPLNFTTFSSYSFDNNLSVGVTSNNAPLEVNKNIANTATIARFVDPTMSNEDAFLFSIGQAVSANTGYHIAYQHDSISSSRKLIIGTMESWNTTENLVINGDGNVGIGTTGPGAKLHVSAGHILLDNGYYYEAKDGGGTIRNILGLSADNIAMNSPNDYRFLASGNEVVRILNTGNVGIATINPLATFHDNGTAMFGAGAGASLTDSSLVVNYSTGSPVLNWYGTDGDTWNIGINTSDGATFNGATTYNFDNVVINNAPVTLKGYTVATLPAGTVGMTAYVTDATAPTYLGALTGGGAVVTPVFYNGTAWVSY